MTGAAQKLQQLQSGRKGSTQPPRADLHIPAARGGLLAPRGMLCQVQRAL